LCFISILLFRSGFSPCAQLAFTGDLFIQFTRYPVAMYDWSRLYLLLALGVVHAATGHRRSKIEYPPWRTRRGEVTGFSVCSFPSHACIFLLCVNWHGRALRECSGYQHLSQANVSHRRADRWLASFPLRVDWLLYLLPVRISAHGNRGTRRDSGL